MTEREYLEALSRGMQRLVDEAEEQVRQLASAFQSDEWMAQQRTRSLALLDSLEPPAELAGLHARLRSAAEQSPSTPDEHEQIADLLELARRMEVYGFELMPGVTADSIEREMGGTGKLHGVQLGFEAAAGSDWETKLRSALERANHPDVEGAIEHMRRLRNE